MEDVKIIGTMEYPDTAGEIGPTRPSNSYRYVTLSTSRQQATGYRSREMSAGVGSIGSRVHWVSGPLGLGSGGIVSCFVCRGVDIYIVAAAGARARGRPGR